MSKAWGLPRSEDAAAEVDYSKPADPFEVRMPCMVLHGPSNIGRR
jgi:hypothetical protein